MAGIEVIFNSWVVLSGFKSRLNKYQTSVYYQFYSELPDFGIQVRYFYLKSQTQQTTSVADLTVPYQTYITEDVLWTISYGLKTMKPLGPNIMHEKQIRLCLISTSDLKFNSDVGFSWQRILFKDAQTSTRVFSVVNELCQLP